MKDDDASIVFASCATSCRSPKVNFGHLFRRELKENSFRRRRNNSRTSVLQRRIREKKSIAKEYVPPDGDEPNWKDEGRKNSAQLSVTDKYATGRTTVPTVASKGLGAISGMHLGNMTKEGFVIYRIKSLLVLIGFSTIKDGKILFYCWGTMDGIGPMTINYHMLQETFEYFSKGRTLNWRQTICW